MIQPCLHKRAIWFTILLLVIIICFCLFFIFGAAEPASEKQHGSKSEVELSSKELLYVVTVCSLWVHHNSPTCHLFFSSST